VPQTTWAPPGTLPLSDAQAGALVVHQPEIRSDNAQANDYVPSDTELAAFRSATSQSGQTPAQYNSLNQYVTGRPGLSSPSTDDLIQWTAHKWGIPEDWIRAEMVVESYWHQSQLGDPATVDGNSYGSYPAQARIAGTSDVYTSMGISQIKWSPDGSQWPGTEPLRWRSTAFNLDYYGAQIRYYYDGDCGWCGAGYGAGQQWNSIGAWYDPSPWNNGGAQSYIQKVQSSLSDRTWSQPGF
jgi:hypothetical protein